MANLEKVIKVTQSQYDILASGGRVGDYVGLDDNYIYLIEDTNTYITSNGGTIDGNLEIDGRLTLHNNIDEPLDIYYNNEDCYFLVLHPNTQDYDNKYRLDVEEIENHEEGENPFIYDLTLPARSGILAIREEIPTNYVTTDTAQTIAGDKTVAYGNKTSYTLKNGNTFDLSGNQYNYFQVGYNGIGMYSFGTSQFFPNSNNSRNLGTSSLNWKDLYLAGGTIYKNVNQSNYWKTVGDAAGNVILQVSTDNTTYSNILWVASNQKLYTKDHIPTTNNIFDLGTSSTRWKDLYLSGKVDFGAKVSGRTNTSYIATDNYDGIGFWINGIRSVNVYENATYFSKKILPNSTTVDIGDSTHPWRDAYISRNLTDGTNSITVAEVVAKQDAIEVKRYI